MTEPTTGGTQDVGGQNRDGRSGHLRRIVGPPWQEMSTRQRSARGAWIAFAAYATVAFYLLTTQWGEAYWFIGDDWGMIVGRDLFDVGDWFRPQNGHWSTLPHITYQALYKIVGVRTYGPYQEVVILLHLVLATLLRVIMRRAGVGPWMATVVAGTFVLFGAGSQNILQAIQVSMVGSLVFGLIHVLLADHDGPGDYRDGLGLLAGAVALSAAGVGLLMVGLAGVSTLLRRGRKPAALHTAPLISAVAIWYALIDPSSQQQSPTLDVGVGIDWTLTGVTGVFMAFGEYRPVAIALVVLLFAGSALAISERGRSAVTHRLAVPTAMLLPAIGSFALVSSQRASLPLEASRGSRYMAISLTLLLPALAVAADAVVGRWRHPAPVVGLLALIGVPANIRAPETSQGSRRPAGRAETERQAEGADMDPAQPRPTPKRRASGFEPHL